MELNEYLVVTNNNRGHIAYAGRGFSGMADDEDFIERYQPVDPADVDETDSLLLLNFCKPGTLLSTGFYYEDHK